MNKVRITGGEWRSRLVVFPDAVGLRPTPDRVRETLFNWLGQDLGGLDCLDLFAGSGILGFEAASRGAAHVTLVESDRAVCASLRKNAASLGNDGLEVVCADAVEFLPFCSRRYDLAFVDPPYRQGWVERIEQALLRVLKPDALIYVEAEHKLENIGSWTAIRHGRAGQVHFHLLQAGES